MKTVLTFLLLLMPAFLVQAQESRTCCDENAVVKFSRFGSDMEFVSAHNEPGGYKLSNAQGTMITFSTPDGKTGNAYEVKAETPANKYLLVFHEWYGLNDYIKSECDKWSSELGVNVIGVDLYDGKVAANNKEASQYVQSVETERGINIIKGVREYAPKDAIFATMGWCFGGGWSCQAAILLEEKCKACVIYYGMPEENKEKLAKLSAPVYGIFASKDKWINSEVVSSFVNNMSLLGKKVTVKVYDAEHAFSNPSNPNHDEKAATDAKALVVDFLKENFK
ncbi:MAG: dienelactone hydrolase family protein [Bacteroidetes bacterium]|nr:dienelactone hydrolase family protein [Bacteroidota bacterium]